MLAPLFPVMIEGHFGRIAHELGQDLDRAAGAAVPIARQHAVSKRVSAGIAGVSAPLGIVIPVEPGTKRAEHLRDVKQPMLFLQGTRDAFADLKLLRQICAELRPRVTLHVIETADHSFHVLKASGKTDANVLQELAQTAAAWARENS